jgi:hypothetical protein
MVKQMLAKLQPYLSWLVTHKSVVAIGVVFAMVLAASFYFRTAPLIVSYDPVIPNQPTLPKVDYSVDKDRLGCILNHTSADVQKMCEAAFPYKK